MIRKLLIILIFLFLLYPRISKGYDNFTTHPALTDEIVDFYNLSFDNKLTDQEKELIVQGSIDEDLPPRWINHFYDPTNGDGWKAENLGYIPPTALKIFSKLFLNFNTEIVSSKDWAHNEILQEKYADYGGNNTWENAIRQYVKGDKAIAYYALGHILHLIEDKTVPDHTRNDTHAHEVSVLTRDEGSPYEDYAKHFTRQTLNIADDLKNKNYRPIVFSSINEYFDYLASYSNKYFFSENTIPGKYNNPRILRENDNYGHGEDKDGKDILLVDIFKNAIDLNTGDIIKKYTLKDDNNIVLSSYFSRLSKEAILSGVGVIKLFKEEVEKAEKDSSLIKDEPKISWWQKTVSPFYGVVNTYNNIKASILNLADNVNNIIDNILTSKPIDQLATIANISQVAENISVANKQDVGNKKLLMGQQDNSVKQEVKQGLLNATPTIEEGIKETNEDNNSSLIIHYPYQWPVSTEIIHEPYQRDLIIPSQQQKQSSFIFVAGSNVTENNKKEDEHKLNSENIEILTNEVQNNSVVTQEDSSGGDVRSSDSQDHVVQVDNQTIDSPSQDNRSVDNQAQNEDIQNVANGQPQDIIEPVSNPDIKFYLADYDVRKQDFALNWKDENRVVKDWELQYKLAPNFDWQSLDFQPNIASPDEGNIDFTAKYDNLTYYFRLRGKDGQNNFTDWQYLQADISTKLVVINEIAWMGTQASANDEWIELANKTDQEIDLNGWKLKTSDGAINVTLTGKISSYGFYLLERTNDDTVKNIKADQVYTGALVDNGQSLNLYDKDSLEMDSTYTVFAGDKAGRRSSERISIWASGEESKNWKIYVGVGDEAQDAKSNKILGTPKYKNSQANLYHYLSNNLIINKDAIFLQNRGPYVADSLINISQSGILNIEPGTVLKFGYLGGLNIDGKFIAKGTVENKIVFTSMDDDEYGGDTNKDGQSKIINWRKIVFNDGSSGELDNDLFRCAGNVWTTDNEVIYINKAKTKISNSIFENMGKDVFYFKNSDAIVSSSEFKNNNGVAIISQQGAVNVVNNVFNNNSGEAISIRYPNEVDWTDTYPTWPINISGNTFTKNKAPLKLNTFGNFDIHGNTMDQNDYNGILFDVANVFNNSILILSADMPFVFVNTLTVHPGGILNISPGTIVKLSGTAIYVQGILRSVGTPEGQIVFTSINDDEYGGDTNNDGLASSPKEKDWYGVNISNGSEANIENTVIKYAGKLGYSMGGLPSGGSAIVIESNIASFTMKNSEISNSVTGINSVGNGIRLDSVTFADNSSAGLLISGNDIVIQGVTFNDNQKAIQSDPATIANILFSNLIIDGKIYDFWPENLTSPLSP